MASRYCNNKVHDDQFDHFFTFVNQATAASTSKKPKDRDVFDIIAGSLNQTEPSRGYWHITFYIIEILLKYSHKKYIAISMYILKQKSSQQDDHMV